MRGAARGGGCCRHGAAPVVVRNERARRVGTRRMRTSGPQRCGAATVQSAGGACMHTHDGVGSTGPAQISGPFALQHVCVPAPGRTPHGQTHTAATFAHTHAEAHPHPRFVCCLSFASGATRRVVSNVFVFRWQSVERRSPQLPQRDPRSGILPRLRACGRLGRRAVWGAARPRHACARAAWRRRRWRGRMGPSSPPPGARPLARRVWRAGGCSVPRGAAGWRASVFDCCDGGGGRRRPRVTIYAGVEWVRIRAAAGRAPDIPRLVAAARFHSWPHLSFG